MDLRNLRVNSLDVDTRGLTWEVFDSSNDPYLDYEVEVQRSESPEGPFAVISPAFRARFRFTDTHLPPGNRYRQFHYRLRLRHIPTGRVEYTSAATQEPLPDITTLEIRRHLQILYREVSGRRCWLLPARTFGRRCPKCWDPELDQRTSSKCLSCYDTSFLGGYLQPIEVFIDIDPNGNSNQPSQLANMQSNATTARMGHYPSVKPDDLIIEGENHRWIVTKTTQTEHLRAPVQQHLTMIEVFPQDIEMRIPLDLGQAIEDVWFSPQRSYTNIQDLDAVTTQNLRLFYGLLHADPPHPRRVPAVREAGRKEEERAEDPPHPCGGEGAPQAAARGRSWLRGRRRDRLRGEGDAPG